MQNLSSAAVVIGALRVKIAGQVFIIREENSTELIWICTVYPSLA